MDTKKQKAIGAALRALADAFESDDAGSAAADTGAASKKPAGKKTETPPSPADVANRGASAAGAGTNAVGDLMAQARAAAKSYAEVYGREGLKEVLGKYTQGTLADIPTDKLPEVLKELS